MSALPFPEPPLTDGVVTLRAWRDEDAAMKAAWGQDAVVVRWTGVPANYTQDAALSWAVQTEEARQAGRTLAPWRAESARPGHKSRALV